jgi:hypothetical protein
LVRPSFSCGIPLTLFSPTVSALIAQGTEFPLRKPAGFHWDLFLLGVTTGVAGILGLPFPNGLIPQAPFHTQSLCVSRTVKASASSLSSSSSPPSPSSPPRTELTHVVEQRVSNLAQGLLTLGTMSGPLLSVLHLIPHGVLAGLFFVMGIEALAANGITAKLAYLFSERGVAAPDGPDAAALRRLPRQRAVWAFVAVELVGFAATFAITQTVAAVGFPVFIMALIPVRALLLPRWFTEDELAALDGPTASPFIMEGISGARRPSVGVGSETADDGSVAVVGGDEEKAAGGGGGAGGGCGDEEAGLRRRDVAVGSGGGGGEMSEAPR